MTSRNGQADWPDDDAYLADLTSYISRRTGLTAKQVQLAERTSRLYEAACYRGFGGPIMCGFESTDFDALNAKYPDIIPAKDYFVHPSHADRVEFVAAEANLTHCQTVAFLAGEMAFTRAAGISAREADEERAFLEWAAAKGWHSARPARPPAARNRKPGSRSRWTQLRLVDDVAEAQVEHVVEDEPA